MDKHNHLPPKECLELFASWLTEKIAEKAPEVSEFFIFHSEMSLYARLNQTQAKVMLGCNKKIFETLGELFNRLGVAMGCKPKYSAQMVGETVLNLVVCSWRTYDLQPNEEYMVAFLRLVLPPVLMNLFSAD